MCCLPPWHLLTSAPSECVHGMAQAPPEALSYSDEAFSYGKSKKSGLSNPEMLETHWSRKSMWQHSHGTVLPATHFRNFLPSAHNEIDHFTAQRVISDRSYYATVVKRSLADDTVRMRAIHVICLHQHHKIDGLCCSGGNI